jgi:dihydrofolate reductase
MSRKITGHAIVSADGRIADRTGMMPTQLRRASDWARFQAALDRAELVVLGRRGHEAHVNPGRRRLVLTRRIERLERIDALVTLWNPAGLDLGAALAELGIDEGDIAVTGGQAVFDQFLPHFTGFDLAIVDDVLLPDGVPCFSGGWPDEVLTGAGLAVAERGELEPGLRLELWRR